MRSSVRSGRPYEAEDWVEVVSHRLGIVGEPRRRDRPPREKMLLLRKSGPELAGWRDNPPRPPWGGGGARLAGGRLPWCRTRFHGTDIGAP